MATDAELIWPTDMFVDASGNVYIADRDNNRIRKVDASTGIISTVAGGGTDGYGLEGCEANTAELLKPTGIFVDSSGTMYICDAFHHRIRKVVDAAEDTVTPPPAEPPAPDKDKVYFYPHPMKCPGGNAVFKMEKGGAATLQVITLRGQVVKEIRRDLAASDTAKVPILCTDVKDGVYLIRVDIKYSDGTAKHMKPYKFVVTGGK